MENGWKYKKIFASDPLVKAMDFYHSTTFIQIHLDAQDLESQN
jgi:hypothetical protein